jgi:cell division protein ZapA (FtsZ GTPase activity inhibitor)
MTQSDLRLDILGASFTITADEDADYLEEILKNYRAAVENIQNTSGLKDPLKIAVLTGFLLSDEIHKLKVNADRGAEAEKLTLDLIARMDALPMKISAIENPAVENSTIENSVMEDKYPLDE